MSPIGENVTLLKDTMSDGVVYVVVHDDHVAITKQSMTEDFIETLDTVELTKDDVKILAKHFGLLS